MAAPCAVAYREFVQLCFPELFPPLNIAAMQAMQAKRTPLKEQPSGMKSHHSIGDRELRGSEPTPMHALPSGRIGQLLIRRSGRVHLRLLTEASPVACSNSSVRTSQDYKEEASLHQGTATNRVRNSIARKPRKYFRRLWRPEQGVFHLRWICRAFFSTCS